MPAARALDMVEAALLEHADADQRASIAELLARDVDEWAAVAAEERERVFDELRMIGEVG